MSRASLLLRTEKDRNREKIAIVVGGAPRQQSPIASAVGAIAAADAAAATETLAIADLPRVDRAEFNNRLEEKSGGNAVRALGDFVDVAADLPTPSAHGALVLSLPRGATSSRSAASSISGNDDIAPTLLSTNGTGCVLQVRDGSGRLVLLWRDLRRFRQKSSKSNNENTKIPLRITAMDAHCYADHAWLIGCGMCVYAYLIARMPSDQYFRADGRPRAGAAFV